MFAKPAIIGTIFLALLLSSVMLYGNHEDRTIYDSEDLKHISEFYHKNEDFRSDIDKGIGIGWAFKRVVYSMFEKEGFRPKSNIGFVMEVTFDKSLKKWWKYYNTENSSIQNIRAQGTVHEFWDIVNNYPDLVQAINKDESIQEPKKANVTLSWQPSIDPESGISYYKIYKDGVFVGKTEGEVTKWKDIDVKRGVGAEYRISAVNGVDMETEKSIPYKVYIE